MNNLDQVALKLNRAAAELRENIAACLSDARQMEALVQAKLDEEDRAWLAGKLAGLATIEVLMADDGFLRKDAPLEETAQRLEKGAFDRDGWKQVLGEEQAALADRVCDREQAVLQGLRQLVKLRNFLHGILRSMLTGMDEGGIGF